MSVAPVKVGDLVVVFLAARLARNVRARNVVALHDPGRQAVVSELFADSFLATLAAGTCVSVIYGLDEWRPASALEVLAKMGESL